MRALTRAKKSLSGGTEAASAGMVRGETGVLNAEPDGAGGKLNRRSRNISSGLPSSGTGSLPREVRQQEGLVGGPECVTSSENSGGG